MQGKICALVATLTLSASCGLPNTRDCKDYQNLTREADSLRGEIFSLPESRSGTMETLWRENALGYAGRRVAELDRQARRAYEGCTEDVEERNQ